MVHDVTEMREKMITAAAMSDVNLRYFFTS